MSLKDTLGLKLPLFHQGSTSMDEFMSSVGELLDGFKNAINDFQKYDDFDLIPEPLIKELASQFGVSFPRNVSEKRRRDYLREIITLYRSKGTKDSLKRVFRIIGWDVEIDEFYIISPKSNVTYPYTITNDEGSSFIVNALYDKLSMSKQSYKNNKVYVDLKIIVEIYIH